MKFGLSSILLILLLATGCSSNTKVLTLGSLELENNRNPLKTAQDIKIEKLLSRGDWTYQHQDDDCKDTNWKHSFNNKNQYYKSVGSACDVPEAFSVEAEAWYIKHHHLYIVNLSPKDEGDIILKYTINHIDDKKLVLGSNGYKYTFTRAAK